MSQMPHASFVQADAHYGVQRHGGYETYESTSPWAGWLAFAAVVMTLMGGLYVVAGLVTLLHSSYYKVNTTALTVDLSWRTLGWTQLILGVLIAAAGISLVRGHVWARAVAVVVAGVGLIENFLTIGASPVWNLIQIALAIMVIYAVVVHGRAAQTATA